MNSVLHDVLVTLAYIVAIVALFAGGYVVGRHNGRIEAEEAHERLLRLEPPDRTPGQPTNLGGDPSKPRSAQWRSGRFDGGSSM